MTIFDEIKQEQRRQDGIWGEQNHDPFYWLTIIGEEYGEACKGALIDGECHDSWFNYRKELVEVAASAVAAIESLDRGKWRE